jgi:hypothetical protein
VENAVEDLDVVEECNTTRNKSTTIFLQNGSQVGIMEQ